MVTVDRLVSGASIRASITPRMREIRLSIYLLNRNRLTRAAIIGVLLLVFVAMTAPWIAPSKGSIEGATYPSQKLESPSLSHLFGTDDLGRDIFSRVLYGTRISLVTAVITVGLSMLVGVPLGAIAGTVGGRLDDVLMRITDVFLSFPSILMAITIAAFLGPSLRNAILAIVISWWPYYARVVRGQAVMLRERQFVKAAKSIGTNAWFVTFRHILPNSWSPVIVQGSLDLGNVILMLAALSFLGLGAQPPTPEWGLMISTSRPYFLSAWWWMVFPGLAIIVTVLLFNLVGDGLREILDPRTRKI